MPPFLIDAQFRSLEEFLNWRASNEAILSEHAVNGVGRRILDAGFIEPASGRAVAANEIAHEGTNWREGLTWNGINSRQRAVLKLIWEKLDDPSSVNVFAPEAVTAFAMFLRGRLPRFYGSEYTDDPELRKSMYPIPFQDLTALTLASDAFHIVTTNEVLEHVPDLDTALAEMCRVLRPGGWHIGTHPFRLVDRDSEVKAKLVNGEIQHLTTPEYHGNPFGEGSLVFEVPGWDILERSRKAGFSDAFMHLLADESAGILGSHAGGIFVLCLRK